MTKKKKQYKKPGSGKSSAAASRKKTRVAARSVKKATRAKPGIGGGR
jgi:hypothetical protein